MAIRRTSRQRIVAFVITCLGTVFSVQTASAAPPKTTPASYSETSVKPYVAGWTSKECGGLGYCKANATSDHLNGNLALDVESVGTKGFWFYCWPVCTYGLYDAGVYASAQFSASQNIPQPVKTISITVIAETKGAAFATGAAGSEIGLKARAYVSDCCQGGTSFLVASSDGRASGVPGTQTLTFTVTRADGSNIPAGRLWIGLALEARAGGVGTATGSGNATILSVSSFQQ